MENLDDNLKSTVETARQLASDLGTLAANWIRYGVSIGENAMHESARTLDQTARALGKIADRLKAG